MQHPLPLHELVGREICITFLDKKSCIACQRSIKKTYHQGYCYPCMISLAQCDRCIVKPELCHYHLGTCREPQWGEAHCMQPHVVYLAYTSDVKVGITKTANIPGRWLDSGAIVALPWLQVPTRQLSGMVEVLCKSHVNDRTQWQHMLRFNEVKEDFNDVADGLYRLIEDDIKKLESVFEQSIVPYHEASVRRFDYPVMAYPEKMKQINLDKQSKVQGILKGLKGQYLLFDEGVFNMRKHAGYHIHFSAL